MGALALRVSVVKLRGRSSLNRMGNLTRRILVAVCPIWSVVCRIWPEDRIRFRLLYVPFLSAEGTVAEK